VTVRLRLALAIFGVGLLTALGVVATVLVAFQRFDHESSYHRATQFLDRVVRDYPDLFELHAHRPQEFTEFLRSLVLYEPDTQLYLLDAAGTVLASTGQARLPPGFRVALAPVQQAAGPEPMPYVMGDDPERMDADAVIAARPLQRAQIMRAAAPVAGYLYLVCHKPPLPPGRLEVLRSSLALPVAAFLAGWIGLTTLLALSVTGIVTRPLRELTERVGAVARGGLEAVAAGAPAAPWPQADRRDEFGRLAAGFRTMLQRLHEQWQARQRIEHFRREGVSNLSHDLRSPLTAAAACLETLQARLGDDERRADEQRLVEVALRNTGDAARLVRSLGELAQLDEPSFALTRERLDAAELLDGIALRFAPRAAAQGASIAVDAAPPLPASLDVELFERAVANLVDNALRHGARPGGAAGAAAAAALHVVLGARRDGDALVVSVADDGAGIGSAELPRLFDRFHHSRGSAAGDGGRGLGLAIVKRIAELHGGTVAVQSRPGAGTSFTLRLPAG
jgi:signal transduction histidine kinase